MGRPIAHSLFPKFHTNNINCDNQIMKKLSSGKVFNSVIDTKRTNMSLIERNVNDYYKLNFNNKPIYSNVHITSDIDSKYIPGPALNFFLRNQLIETKNFYQNNKHIYSPQQFAAIEEAINDSYLAEKEIFNTGEIGAFNKILYNASKFITKDEMYKILKISNLI